MQLGRSHSLAGEGHPGALQLRDERLVKAYTEGRASVTEELVFLSDKGTVLDPDNRFTITLCRRLRRPDCAKSASTT